MTTLTTHTPTRFSRPRFALLVLLGAYPVITAILYFVFPLTDGWTIWQRTVLVAPVMVGAMVWGVIPAVQQWFRGFINPAVGQAN
jgi:antibiotic biosynthesis monooxygenase (ABM) superfamily enzyme